jgi:hypothetical protein
MRGAVAVAMLDVIAVATLLLACMLIYELVSGNVVRRNMLARAVRKERPRNYWRAIIWQFCWFLAGTYYVLYILSPLKH